MIPVKRKRKAVEEILVTHNTDGTLNRVGALIEARKKLGEMATISSDERKPFLVWIIGAFGRSIGRSNLSWEQAIERSRVCLLKPE